jgi:methionyl-tRNA formyltransferase
MKMDAGMDTGPILAQKRTAILREDDAATLHNRLAQLGAELLLETVPGYVGGKILPKPQSAEASYAPKIKKDDEQIDWHRFAQSILNRLRAFTPWPGAFTSLKAESKSSLLKFWRAEVIEKNGRAGEILSADESGMVIACGKNALRILELQPEGGRRMSAREFLAGHALKAGGKF